MSGSDGASTSGGDWGGGDDDDCSKVVLDATLEAPLPGQAFVVGKSYDVQLVVTDTIETVQLLDHGASVGAIRPTPPLLRCLRKGVSFGAEVMSSSGGDVKVRVRAI